jgi:hypothetical protein
MPRRGHESAKRQFIAVMDEIEGELGAAGGPYFLGKELSLVDCVFAPMLERIAAAMPYYKGFVVRGEGCACCHAKLQNPACTTVPIAWPYTWTTPWHDGNLAGIWGWLACSARV